MKVIIDNNFFENFILLNPVNQELLKRAFTNNQLAFYGTLELLSEFVVIGDKEKQGNFKEILIFLLEHNRGIFNQVEDIIIGEINNAKKEFLTAGEITKIKDTLFKKEFNNLAIQDLGRDIRVEKIRQLTQEKTVRQIVLSAIHKVNIRNCRPSFGEYYNEEKRKEIMLDVLDKIDIQKLIAVKKRDKIISRAEFYPYFHAYCKNYMVLDYHQNILEKGVRWGDDWDVRYLTYLEKVDCLISYDHGVRELAELSYGRSKKVFSLAELISEVRGKGVNFETTLKI